MVWRAETKQRRCSFRATAVRIGYAGSLAALAGGLGCAGGGGPPASTERGVGQGRSVEHGAAELAVGSAPSAVQLEGALIDDAQRGKADPTGAAWRIIEVPAASNEPNIVQTPLGWYALSHRSIGHSRTPQGYETALYHSANGVEWQRVSLAPNGDDLMLRGLAYGNGRFVMVGRRYSGPAVVWSSEDAEDWTEVEQGLDLADSWGSVAFAGQYFFAFGFRYLGVSQDGVSWRYVSTDTVAPRAVAHGNGRYLLVGSGPMQVSADASSWQSPALDCSLTGACITDPSGGVHQGVRSNALFAEGRFYTDQLSSSDGFDWRPEPERVPATYVAGAFLGHLDTTSAIQTWNAQGPVQQLQVVRPSREAVTARGRAVHAIGLLPQDAPLPEQVDAGFEDGLTCLTASCVIVGSRLLLVPPLGTPPLPDRVPRRADGVPLLSDECPVSSMIFCEDYAARTGCVCEPEAPAGPTSCQDVSHYQCAGAFTSREHEWELEEVAQAGCSCDAVDPNQPPTFGNACSEGDQSACAEPLRCLGIDTPSSPGPPVSQPFICTAPCSEDADCPSWQATGFCAGPVSLRCSGGSCQPRECE